MRRMHEAADSGARDELPLRPLWLIDPISYSGMAYSDAGQIIALAALGQDVVLLGSDSWMLGEIGVRRITIFRGTYGDRSRWRRGLAYVLSLARLIRRSAALRPLLVHWQYSELPIGDWLTMLVLRLRGVRQVYTAHELVPWSARRHHRWLFGRIYRTVDAIVVHNDDQYGQLTRSFQVASSKVRIAPLGDYSLFADLTLSQADARARLGLAADRPIALFFGAIRPAKGLEDLLRAWVTVVAAVPDAQLLVVGKPFKGMNPAAVVDLIEALGTGHSVTVRFQQVDPMATNLYYRATDVVVLPYRAIGTSGVLRYAYNSERPVVATLVGEHRTHVRVGETGHLVEPGNIEEIGAVLASSLSDRPLLHQMGRSARAYATDNFDWLDSARILRALYRELIGTHDGRAHHEIGPERI